MDREELIQILRELVEEETGDPCPQLDPTTNLRAGLSMDSMDLVSLLFHIENRFKIEISSDRFAGVVTVGQLLDLLQEEIAKGTQCQPA
jgi:acyl carrier protein